VRKPDANIYAPQVAHVFGVFAVGDRDLLERRMKRFE
jgi:hypothetical protein